jgi:hypothetical protein
MEPNKMIQTRDIVIQTKAGDMVCPAINYDSPFPLDEFKSAPVMTEEEVIAQALEVGCPPAGWEIIQRRRLREKQMQMLKNQQEKDKVLKDNKGNKKNLNLKQLKALELAERKQV